jgi:hypothetical protein
MKKTIYLFAGIFMLGATLNSCSSDDDNNNAGGNTSTTVELSGDLTSRVLTKDKNILLKDKHL